MSQGGSERDQIFLFQPKGGRARLLTDGRSRNMFQAVTRDGSKVAFASNARNGRDTDIYIMDPRVPGSAKLVLKGDGQFWEAHDWSADGSKLLVNRYVSINESYPGVLDVNTGKTQMLPIPGKPPASFELLRFSPDSKSVYVGTDANSEFKQLARLNLETMQYTWLTAGIPWDVDAIHVDPATGRVVFTINEDGASALYLLEGDQPIRLKHPPGVITGPDFSPDGIRLGFTLARYDAPPDVYSIDLGDRKLQQWTYSEIGGLARATFVSPSPIRFTSFDGQKVPAYIYRPRGASREKPVPVLISIHGGPESQYRPFFSGLEQFFVSDFGIRRHCAQRARLIRLRQSLFETRQRGKTRRQRAGHRRSSGLDRYAIGSRCETCRRDGGLVRRIHGARIAHAFQRSSSSRRRHRRSRQFQHDAQDHKCLPT